MRKSLDINRMNPGRRWCGYNHDMIAVCPVCSRQRFVRVPVRVLAGMVWR